MNISNDPEHIGSNSKTLLVDKDTYKDYTMEDLLTAYSPLAKNYCGKYYKETYDYDDMLQEANIAIINAYNSYNLQSHVSIGHYLTICINNALINFCATERNQIFNKNTSSLDKSITNESYNNDSYNFIIDDNSSKTIDQNLDKMYLSQLLVMLEPKEQKVLTELYLNDQTQEKIANEFNVSQSYISRIKSHSLKKMHKLINNDNLLM